MSLLTILSLSSSSVVFCEQLYLAIILVHFTAVIWGWNNAMAVLATAVATVMHYFTILNLKSRIQETLNLSTDADSSTDTSMLN